MSKNKLFLAFLAVAAVAVILLVLSRDSDIPVKLDSQAKPESKPVPVVQTKQVPKQTAGQTASNITSEIPATTGQSLPLPVETDDLSWLQDETIESVTKEAASMLDYPIHPGRAKLREQMRKETADETFLHLTDNDNYAVLMPSMGGYPFSPGTYGSDVMMISKMTRVRKLLADARENPYVVASFLEQQLKTLAPQFSQQYKEFQETHKTEPPEGHNSGELPDYMKTSILCTTAVYVLSQIENVDSLPVFAWLYEQTEGKKHLLPVNEKFLFYAMHNSLQKAPDYRFSGQEEEIRNKYLKKATSMRIPNARQVEVTTWDAYYHEDDFRRKIPGMKVDLSSQPQIKLERFPSLERVRSRKVKFLLKELVKLVAAS